jgi:hypothetical protein
LVDPVTGAIVARSYFITDGAYGSFNGLIYELWVRDIPACT